MPPKISVVIPTYNRASVVPTAIASVMAQTLRPHEIIVVNDGSKDNTTEVLAGYGDTIRAITQANTGLSGARNTGIHAATGEWIAFLDDDDEWIPARLATAAETIARHPDIGVHATNTAIVLEDGTELDMFSMRGRKATEHMRIDRPLEWILGGCFFAQTIVARRDVLVAAGLFRKTFYEDMDLFIRLAARTPWTVDVRRSLRLIRRPGEDLNLSSIWRSKPVENFEALARIHREALTLMPLTAQENDVVRRGLGTNLFELGRALLAKGETTRARACFAESARTFPRLHSRLKSRFVALFGRTGLRCVDAFRPRRKGVFRSS